MTTLIEKSILNERLEKSRSGTYTDTSENRRKHRVGQKYGSEKKEEEKPEKTDPNKMSPEQQLEAINKVIAAVNEGKLKLPPEEINTLVAKKTMAEEAVKQAKGEKKAKKKSSKEKIQEEEKKRGYRFDDNIINDPNKTKEEKIAEIKDKYAKLAKDNAKDLGDTPIGPDMVDLQKRKRVAIQKIEAQEETKNSGAQNKRDFGFKNSESLMGDDGSVLESELKKNPVRALKTFVSATAYRASLDKEFKGLEARSKVAASIFSKLTDEEKQKVTKKMSPNELEIIGVKSSESKKESVADKEDLRAAREKLGYLQDNEERLIKRDGKEKYEERLKQAKDEVAKLKGEKPKEETKPEPKKEEDRKAEQNLDEFYANRKKEGFVSLGNGNMGKIKSEKSNGDLIVEYARFGEKNWVDTVQRGSSDFKALMLEKNSGSETEESYTRVKFEDVPNSGKVNLKKYLSEKVRKGVDEKWSNIKNIPTDNLKKMEKGLVNDLNKNFEAIKKSQRAELLYSIMKVKGELEKRGKESQKKE